MTSSDSKRIYLSPPHLCGKEMEYLQEAFESNFIAPVGPQLDQFEEKFKELTGFENCVALANGTSAIHLGLKLLGVTKGDTVIASSMTFIGGVSPIKFLDANPVFVDSDHETWNMDPHLLADELARMIDAGTPPKAVLPTDIYGQSCDLDAIKAICEPHGIPVLVDCAESVGARYKDRATGIGAEAAAFSFNGNKIITTSNGGILASDDEELIERCRFLATQAREPQRHYEHEQIGFNYRMSNILAAIGLGQLDVLEERVNKRRAIFDGYIERLSDVEGITFMPEAEYSTSNRWLTVALIDQKTFGCSPDTVMDELEKSDIESRPIWKPMHLQPVFRNSRMVGGPVAEGLFENGICLPSGTALTDSDLDRICDIITSSRLLTQQND